MKTDSFATKLLLTASIVTVSFFFFYASDTGPISSIKNAWPLLAFAVLAFIKPKSFYAITSVLSLLAIIYIALAYLLAKAFPPSAGVTLDYIDLGFAYGLPVYAIWLFASLVAYFSYKNIVNFTLKPRLLAFITTPSIVLAGYYSMMLPIVQWFR